MSYFKKIKRLTSQRSAFGLTLHIGRKGDRFPSSVDYFIADGAFKERFNALYANDKGVVQPNTLDILFLPPDIRRVCRLFKEFRDGAGVVRGRVFVDWFSEHQPEKFVIYTPEIPDGVETSEAEFASYTAQWKATAGADTLQLIFHLRKFLEQGILTLCQIQTRGDDSSIPGILTQLEQMDGLRKLDVPYILSVSMANSKGMKASSGEAEAHKFPVLSLFPDFSQKAIDGRNGAVRRFMELQALPIFTPQPKALTNDAPQNALNAAPEHADAIDAEHTEVEPPIDAVTAEGDALVASWQEPLSESQQKAKAYWQQYRLSSQLEPKTKAQAVARMRELTPPAEPQAKPMREPGEEG